MYNCEPLISDFKQRRDRGIIVWHIFIYSIVLNYFNFIYYLINLKIDFHFQNIE